MVTRCRLTLLGYSLAATVLVGATARSQERSGPKEFYPNRFVNESEKSHAQGTKSVSPELAPAHKTPPASQPSVAGSVEVVLDNMKSKSSIALTAQLAGQGTPVRALSAILSTEDGNHFRERIKELAEVSAGLHLPVGVVYMVGSAVDPTTDTQMRDDLGALFTQGGIVLPALMVPEKYPVKLSPTWIIEIEGGEILLEGVASLRKYLSTAGNFVDQ